MVIVRLVWLVVTVVAMAVATVPVAMAGKKTPTSSDRPR